MSDNEIEFIGDIKLHMVPSGYNKTLLAATADAKAKVSIFVITAV